jgi:hypothetical protein
MNFDRPLVCDLTNIENLRRAHHLQTGLHSTGTTPVISTPRFVTAALVLILVCSPASAINIVIDYSYDTNNFFGAGNPQGSAAGAKAKAALDTAASYFSTILNDTFSPIVTPPTFHSSVFDGQVTWTWTATFSHPATGIEANLVKPAVLQNEYRIYAGARNLAGTTAGIGGPGGFEWSSDPSGGFTFEEIDQIDQITAGFELQVEKREETTGFASWGGSIAFDRDNSTTWHYDHTTAPSGNVTDFYSVVVHELTHALGFGSTNEFQTFVSGSDFFGSNAMAAYGGPVPLSGNAHWAYETQSTIYGTSTAQEAAMDPDVLNGTRKVFTTLDGAALTDLGWELGPPPSVSPTGDYNGNGTVDAADYIIWRNTSGQGVTAGTGADGSNNGSVGPEDYTYWRNRFGTIIGSGTGSLAGGTAVPEPATSTFVMGCAILPLFWRKGREAILALDSQP